MSFYNSIYRVLTSQAITNSLTKDNRMMRTMFFVKTVHRVEIKTSVVVRRIFDVATVTITMDNTDESVTKLKGIGRPINSADRRLAVLAGLASVDWVTCFEGDTPETLLREIQPDILFKGGDYDKKGVVGWEIVEGYGGEVKVMGMTPDCSTTAIVEKINQGK